MFQNKTQTAENGHVLLKGCNVVLGHLGTSLWANWELVVRGVAPLGKDQAITREARLSVNHFPTR